jgi:hypothetical protein
MRGARPQRCHRANGYVNNSGGYCSGACVCFQTHPTTKLRYFGEGDPRAALVVPHLDPRIHFALVRKPPIPLSPCPLPPSPCPLPPCPPLVYDRAPQLPIILFPCRGCVSPRLSVLPCFCIVHLHTHLPQVCGARGCPPVRVYSVANLDSALERAAKAFCEDNVSTPFHPPPAPRFLKHAFSCKSCAPNWDCTPPISLPPRLCIVCCTGGGRYHSGDRGAEQDL